MTVYLLHLEPGLPVTGNRVARHYLGFTACAVTDRVAEHLAGRGSPLVAAALAAGSTVTIARTWPGETRSFERQLKNRHETPRLCPTCVAAGATRGHSLLPAGASPTRAGPLTSRVRDLTRTTRSSDLGGNP